MFRFFTSILLGMSSSVTCPSNSLLIHHGSRSALVVTLAVALGAVFGDAAVLVLLLQVIPASLRAAVTGQFWFWMVGALIMGYIAVGQLRGGRSEPHESAGAGKAAVGRGAPTGRFLRSALSGFSVTAFNPFTWVWWLGLFGPGIAADGAIRYEFFGGILIGAALWFTLLAIVVHMVRGRMTPRAEGRYVSSAPPSWVPMRYGWWRRGCADSLPEGPRAIFLERCPRQSLRCPPVTP